MTILEAIQSNYRTEKYVKMKRIFLTILLLVAFSNTFAQGFKNPVLPGFHAYERLSVACDGTRDYACSCALG